MTGQLKLSTLKRMNDTQLIHCVRSNNLSSRVALDTYRQRVQSRITKKIQKMVESVLPEVVEQEHRICALELELNLVESFSLGSSR